MKLFKHLIGFSIAIGIVVAGIAVGQGLENIPASINNDNSLPPTSEELMKAEIPVPGSVREAIACSRDIKEICAPETETRRNVADCIVDHIQQTSKLCISYIKRDLE